MSTDRATFEVWQDGMCVASSSGPREAAQRDALHYCQVYGQDGPVELREIGKAKEDK